VRVIMGLASSSREEALLKLLNSTSQIGFPPSVARPGMIEERISLLRRASSTMRAEPEYRTEAEKRGIILKCPVGGEELQALSSKPLLKRHLTWFANEWSMETL